MDSFVPGQAAQRIVSESSEGQWKLWIGNCEKRSVFHGSLRFGCVFFAPLVEHLAGGAFYGVSRRTANMKKGDTLDEFENVCGLGGAA